MKFIKIIILMILPLMLGACEAGFDSILNDASNADAALASVTLSAGSISPAFERGVTSYTVNAGANTDSLNITAVPVKSDSKMQYSIDSGTWSDLSGAQAVSGLLAATNYTKKFEIQITSNDGKGIAIYSFTVVSQLTKIKVTYNGNGNTGGTVPSDSTDYLVGAEVTVKSSWSSTTGNMVKIEDTSVTTSKAYRCSGWTDGTNTYAEGDKFTVSSSSVTLTAVWTEYAVGDTGPSGGKVFYVGSGYTTGVSSGNWRYMEAAPSDVGYYKWSSSSASISQTDAQDIGTGYENTQAIVNTNSSDNNAAVACNSQNYCSYSGWFLPSINELLIMGTVCGLDTDYPTDYPIGYWSSSQYTSSQACRDVRNSIWSIEKNIGCYVRAARRF